MNRLQVAISLSMLSLAGLTGCAGLSGTAPLVQPDAAPLGNIQGSNFGGHAPVVGAHVYVLQASTAGYGTQATSLLNATYNSNYKNASGQPYVTTANVNDPKIPTTGTGTPWYYETTDNLGAFNISGDYTCTQGLPVYLYAYGGTAAIAPSSVLTSYSYTGTTVTLNGYNLLSVGQTVTFSNITGGPAGLNSGTYTVLTSTLTNFTVTLGGLTGSGSGSLTNAHVTPTLTNNPNIVQLALLGNCPSGTTNVGFAGTINYVYMNEVSTIATAYALSGFMTNSATALTSTDATYLGIPAENGFAGVAAGTSPAWQGIEHAAENAAVLYNIQGTVNGTSGDGEEHIANSAITSAVVASGSVAAGTVTGTVPQALINTMADVLATCVDSNSNSTTTSTACTTLFGKVGSTVGSGGVPSGTAPVDTATVAIDMAHNPGNSNASSLLGLATGTVPYTPTVTATDSTDLVIGITWPVPASEQNGAYTAVTPNDTLGSSAIDADGNIWVGSYQYTTAYNTGYLMQYDHLGNQLFAKALNYNPEQEALDNAGALWVLPNDLGGTGTKGIHKLTGTNFGTDTNYTNATGTTFNNPESMAIDKTGNVYVSVYNGGDAYKLSSVGAIVCLYNQGTNTSWSAALDKNGNFWNSAYGQPPREWLTTNCNAAGGNAASTSGATPFASPAQSAFDQNGNLWVADRTTNSTHPVTKVSATAVSTQIVSGGGLTNGGMSLAIDGDNNVIVGSWNAGTTSGKNLFTILDNAGTYLTSASGLTGNYTISGGSAVTTTEGFWLYGLDSAGNLWSNGPTQLHEYIGVGAPVLTPYAAALNLATPLPSAKP